MQVAENKPPGTSVVTLTAHDNDAEPFNHFRFRLAADGSPSFTIDTSSGVIKTLKTFDREQQDTYQLVGIVEQLSTPYTSLKLSSAGGATVPAVAALSSTVSIVIQVRIGVVYRSIALCYSLLLLYAAIRCHVARQFYLRLKHTSVQGALFK